MHAISRPRFRCCPTLGLVKDVLELREDRTELTNEIFDDFPGAG